MMRIVDVDGEVLDELRKENCCQRAEELKKLFDETGDLQYLLLWNENIRCCTGEK